MTPEDRLRALIEKATRTPDSLAADPVDISINGTANGFIVLQWDRPRDALVFPIENARMLARTIEAFADKLEAEMAERKP